MNIDFDIKDYNIIDLFDYEIVEALLKVKTCCGIETVQTRIKMFVTDKGLDEDLIEVFDDEPIYKWNGINKFEEINRPILKVLEVIEWHL